MLYLPHFFGGLCNNLIQINNALELLNINNINYNFFKINNIHTNSRDRGIISNLNIFENLKKHYVNLPKIFFENTQKICYTKNDIPILKTNINYVLIKSFYCTDYHKGIYEYLDIYNKQCLIYKKYKDILKDKTICFHIRLGDFLTIQKFTRYTYTKNQIIDIIKNHKDNQILILTNPESIDYVKDITKDFKNIIYAYDLNLPLDEELLLGSVCNNIIMNHGSTFSLILFRFNNYFKSS